MLPRYRADPPWLTQPPPIPGRGWCQAPPPVPVVLPPYGYPPIRCPPIPGGWGMPPGNPQWGWQGGTGPPSYPPHAPHHPKQWSDRRFEGKRPRLMRRGGGGGGEGGGGGGEGEGSCEGEMTCEACSKSYKERQHYESHLRSHKKCPHPGCQFEAVHKVLNDHILIHTVRKELFFDTPEEIAKWREERRKKYPTQAAIARKLAVQREKEERGEVLPTRLHRYQRKGYQSSHSDGGRFGRGRWRGGGRGRGRGQRMGNGRDWSHLPQPVGQALPTTEQIIAKSPPEEDEAEEEASDRPGVTSEVSLVASEPVPVFETGVGHNETTNTAEPVISEDIFSEGGIPDVIVAGSVPKGESSTAVFSELNQLVTDKSKLPSLGELSGALESDAFREGHTGSAVSSSHQRGSSRSQQQGPRTRKRLTLLEKLLAPEIRRERNALLQCIKFVVRNNFFDSTDNSPNCLEDAAIPLASPSSPQGEDNNCSEVQNELQPNAPSSDLGQGTFSDPTLQTRELEQRATCSERQSEDLK